MSTTYRHTTPITDPMRNAGVWSARIAQTQFDIALADSGTATDTVDPGVPTLIASYFLNTGATADFSSLVTSPFTPAIGEVIVVKTVAGWTDCTPGTPTGGGLIYTPQITWPSPDPYFKMFTTVTTAASSMTVTIPFGGLNPEPHAAVVERWSSAQLAGTPATVATSGVGAPSATVSTVADNSVVSWFDTDNTTTSGTGRVYRTTSGTPVEEAYYTETTFFSYTLYSAYQFASTAGSQTIGLTTPSQTWRLFGIEVQMAGGPVTKTLGETGTAADTLTVTATCQLNEGAVAATDLDVAVAILLADSATGSDDPLGASISGYDGGVGTDTLTVAAAVSCADTGVAADTTSVSALVSLTESATSIDSRTVAATLTATDSGIGVDSRTVVAAISLNDVGSGNDIIAVDQSGPKTFADAGVTLDGITIASALQQSDTATSSDLGTISAAVGFADSGSATTTGTASSTVAVADAGAASDTCTVAYAVTLADSGIATTVVGATGPHALTDAGIAVDVLIGGPPVSGSIYMPFGVGVVTVLQSGTATAVPIRNGSTTVAVQSISGQTTSTLQGRSGLSTAVAVKDGHSTATAQGSTGQTTAAVQGKTGQSQAVAM